MLFPLCKGQPGYLSSSVSLSAFFDQSHDGSSKSLQPALLIAKALNPVRNGGLPRLHAAREIATCDGNMTCEQLNHLPREEWRREGELATVVFRSFPRWLSQCLHCILYSSWSLISLSALAMIGMQTPLTSYGSDLCC